MGTYRLTQKADQDLTELYLYGITTFGVVQADAYLDSLIAALDALANAPLQFQKSEYREGYRRCVHPPHTLYFRIIDDDLVEVVRILRSQDPRVEI